MEAPPHRLVSQSRIFAGPEARPLLAPRGVWIAHGKLFVADTGQNRVFIWHSLPQTMHAAPDVVLGQPDGAATGRNATGVASAQTLHYPSGIWSDGQRLIVADAWNHRILIWHSLPQGTGAPADVVLGQPGFDHNTPNVEGIQASPSARSMNWPYGVYSDGRALWVADTGNRRVLYFKEIPKVSFTPADGVIGKPSFEERDYDPQDPVWPYSVKVSPQGVLAVADTQFYRVLLWKEAQRAFSQPADVIIGQEGFSANGQNQFRFQPAANTLNWCYDLCFYGEGMWVADTGNSRLLWFPQLPTAHNEAAAELWGRPDFHTGSDTLETALDTSKHIYWPFSLAIEGKTMVVADTGNHRVIINQLHESFQPH